MTWRKAVGACTAGVALAGLAGCGSSTPAVQATATASAPACTPMPCGSSGGVVITVTRVDPSFVPSPRGGPTLDPATHLVLISVSASARVATSLPPTAFQLREANGHLLPVDIVEGGEDCEGIAGGVAIMPGASTGPVGLCFDTGGAAVAGAILVVTLPSGAHVEVPVPAG
jgi:hypothetical protein